MVRKKLSSKQAKSFTEKPIAKKKSDRKAGDRLTESTVKTRKKSEQVETDRRGIGGAALRGMMEETMARVYSEMFPSMTTHDSTSGEVDLEIKEEAYILGIVMVCGTDDYTPRKGLKIREKFMGTMRYCAEHKL